MKKSGLKIRLTFFGAVMIIALFFTHSYISIAAIIASTLHEIGHVIAGKLCAIPLKELKIGIFGASLTTSGEVYSYKKETALAIAGPLVNILSVIFITLFFRGENEFLSLFIDASLFLGILNLLPIIDFDGGRIVFSIFAYAFSPRVALTVIKITSFVLVFILWCFSVYFLLKISSSLSLFIFSVFLFSKLFIISEKRIFHSE